MTDKWIVGLDTTDTRMYIIHTEHPRFLARVLDLDPDGSVGAIDADADRSGLTYYTVGRRMLCEIQWLSPTDGPGENADIVGLLTGAVSALDAVDGLLNI